jgi:hypothetical protein
MSQRNIIKTHVMLQRSPPCFLPVARLSPEPLIWLMSMAMTRSFFCLEYMSILKGTVSVNIYFGTMVLRKMLPIAAGSWEDQTTVQRWERDSKYCKPTSSRMLLLYKFNSFLRWGQNFFSFGLIYCRNWFTSSVRTLQGEEERFASSEEINP